MNGHGKNGENYPRLLKQFQDPMFQAKLNAILDDDPSKRLNRSSRRGLGLTKEQIDQQALDRAVDKMAQQEKINDFRAYKMGEWWRDTFEKLLPAWAFKIVLNGKRWPLHLFGYQWGSEDGNDVVADLTAPLGHRLQPYSRAWITRKRFILFGVPVLQKIWVPARDNPEESEQVETWRKFVWEG
jgi:hypothetical protein